MLQKSGKLVILGLFICLIAICAVPPATVQAVVGVGITPGSISFDEPLSSGVYNIPSITISNTGDEGGNYGIEIIDFEGREELATPAEWFTFSTDQPFYLEANQSKTITITLEIPADADAGNYYGGIEGHPVASEGGVSIGIAAATKISFTVQHDSPGFFARNATAFYIILGVAGLIIVILLFLRFSHTRIRLESR